MQRDLAEERGNLRAAAAMIGLSAGAFVLALVLAQYLIGFLVIPFAVAGAVFGVALSLHYARTTWLLSRRIRALTYLPAARVIQRAPGDTTVPTARVRYPTAR